MKKNFKDILIFVMVVIIGLLTLQTVYQGKVLEETRISKSAWKNNYYTLLDEYKEYQENNNFDKFIEVFND